MAEQIGVRVDNGHLEQLDEMQEAGDADSYSEAVRASSQVGLEEMGYRNGGKQNTHLRAITQRFADAFALLGVFWVGVTFLFPIGFRMWSIPIFVVALGLYGLDRLLKRHEPAVSRRISGWFNGGEPA